ncbi:hypothetical protein COO59_20040 [Mixta theicola]|uniref:HTH araC/xylS-type domain-containing protein n=2 Tax=Mixta theicola TaxID=1458355 RepID=A0A2K1Q4H6_9GAMM|nr:hypothetical protein COO59_20040 [Mixta theicola]
MKRNPGTDLSLGELARTSNSSERTLARLFVSETGMSFRNWRQQLRLVIAIDLLSRGEKITTVAFELGYSSASSFTTFFTRVIGVSPRKFMKLNEPEGSMIF